MILTDWLNLLKRRARRPSGPLIPRPSRLTTPWVDRPIDVVESLEDRLLLATFTVKNTKASGSDSLAAAVASLNSSTETTNTINFGPALSGATITLPSEAPLLIQKPVTITGSSLESPVTITRQAPSDDFVTKHPVISVSITGEMGTVTFDSLVIQGGQAERGAGIYAGPSLMTGQDNRANVTVINSVITGNAATNEGGGIYIAGGLLTLTGTTVSGNSANLGGGIHALGEVRLQQSTVSGNSAGVGGGLWLQTPSATDGSSSSTESKITNSTISGNMVTDSGMGRGGGLHSTGKLSINSSTITNNSSDGSGGGIQSLTGPLVIQNSIVSGNTASDGADLKDGTEFPDPSLPKPVTAKNSLFGTISASGSGITDGSDGNLVGGSAGLAALADNGGLTKTHKLLTGSRAINAGSNSLATGLKTDQRGAERIFGGTVDIGAFELDSLNLVVDTLVDESDGNFGTGDLSLREAITRTNRTLSPDTITFASSLADNEIVLEGGQLTITGELTIDASALSSLTISGDGSSRVFDVRSGSDVEVKGLDITEGSSAVGGAIRNAGTLSIQSSVVDLSEASGGGGLIQNSGTLTVSGSTLSDGVTDSAGGIISNSGTVTITDSLLLSGTAESNGGLIANSATGSTTIIQSTLSDGMAGADGGAIHNLGRLTIRQSTIADNEADGSGGGIQHATSGGALSIFNTIVADNSAATGSDLNVASGAAAPTVTASLIESSTGHSVADGTNGSIVGSDPGLTSLADNGGPEDTYGLSATSPAINAGLRSAAVDAAGNALVFDQRGTGFFRVRDGLVDIGAIEKVLPLPAVPFDIPFTDDVVVNDTGNNLDTSQTPVDPTGTGSTLLTDEVALVRETSDGNGLPSNGRFSATTFNPEFTLDVDGERNARLISSVGDAFSFLVPGLSYRSVHLFALNGSGNGALKITARYSDDSTQELGTVTVPNWLDSITNTPDVYDLIDDLDRIRPDGSTLNDSNDAAVFGLQVAVDESKTLTELSIEKVTGAGRVFLFGVTGIAQPAVLPSVLDLDLDNSGGDTGADYHTTFFQGRAEVEISDDDAVLTGQPGAMLTSMTIVLTSRPDGDTVERLTADVSGTSIAASYTASTGTLLLSGSDTFQNYLDVLRAVKYRNESFGSTSNRTVTVVATDGTRLTNQATVTIDVEVPETIFVDTLVDENDGNFTAGDLSLREAIALATSNNDIDRVAFDQSLPVRTLVLTGGTLTIPDSIVIDGAGDTPFVISGAGRSRVFDIRSGAEVELLRLAIVDGAADTGAGIRNAGRLTFDRGRLSLNVATADGGAIANSGTLTLIVSTLDHNEAHGDGGAIANTGTLTVLSSTLSGNVSEDDGGAVYSSGTASIINSTVSGNRAGQDGGGVSNSGTLTIRNATIAANQATGDGGGLQHSSGSLTVANTILGDNSASGTGADLRVATGATLAQANNNLVEAAAGHSLTNGTAGNIVGSDPELRPLALHTGLTQTHLLDSESPAIDAGQDEDAVDAGGSALPFDQRNNTVPRLVHDVDIGATEFFTTFTVATDVQNASDGKLSLAEAIAAANADEGFNQILIADDPNLTTLTGLGAVTDDLAIIPLGMEAVTLVPATSGFVVSADVEIFDVTISGGSIVNNGKLVLDGVHVRNMTGAGVAITNTGTLVLRESTVSDSGSNSTTAVIHNAKTGRVGNLTLEHSTVSGNKGIRAGAILNDGVLNVTNSTLSGNSAVIVTQTNNTHGVGGAITNTGQMTIVNSTITSNSAEREGGGLHNSSVLSRMTLLNSIVAGNSSAASADIHNASNNNTASALHNLVQVAAGHDIVAGDRGAASGQRGNIVGIAPGLEPLADSLGRTQTHALRGDSAAVDHGRGNQGEDPAGDLLTTDQLSTGSGRFFGSAIDIGAVEFRTAIVVDELDDEDDGDLREGDVSLREAIKLANSRPTIATILFDELLAGEDIELTAGQLQVTSSLTIDARKIGGITIDADDDSRIFDVGSTATVLLRGLTLENGRAADGGAIRNAGVLTLRDSLITDSHATGDGGAISSSGVLSLVNSTISTNHADGHGGGVASTGYLSLHNVTIASNTSDGDGGGLRTESTSSTLTLDNTLIADNSADGTGDDLRLSTDTVVIEAHHNLIETAGGHTLANGTSGNIIGVDPKLGPLADNTGVAQTHRLNRGSAAINAGDNAGAIDESGIPLLRDQRQDDYPRIVDGTVDIGAHESLPDFPVTQFLLGSFNADAIVNQSDGVVDSTQSTLGGREIDLNDGASLADVGNNPQFFLTSSAATELSIPGGNGLPDGGFFRNHLLHPTIQLGLNNDDDGFNTRQLTESGEDFSFPVPRGDYDSVHLLVTSLGESTLRTTFQYSDGSTHTASDLTVPDHRTELIESQNQYEIADGLDTGRINQASLEIDDHGDAAVFGFRIDLPTDSRLLQSVTIAKPGSSGTLLVLGAVGGGEVSAPPIIDLDADDSSEEELADYLATEFRFGAGPVPIADRDVYLADPDSDNLTSMTITLTNRPDGESESLAATTTGTSITASYSSTTGVLQLTGSDSVEDYLRVLTTVVYNNSDPQNAGERIITVSASDGTAVGNVARTRLNVTLSRLFTVDTLTDENDGDTAAGDFSLREAIVASNATPSEDEIQFKLPGTAPHTLMLDSALPALTNAVEIVGPGADLLAIRPTTANDFRILKVNSGVSVDIEGLTFTKGDGALDNAGSLNLERVTISDNTTSGNGGGVLNTGTLIVDSSLIEDSTAARGGGIYNSGMLTVLNSTITENTATVDGGGLAQTSSATATVVRSSFIENTAVNGGAIHNAGTLRAFNATVSGNTADTSGAGVYSSGTLTLTNVTVADNSGDGAGGGIFLTGDSSTTTLLNTIVSDNSDDGTAADLRADSAGTLTVRGSLIDSSDGHSVTSGSDDNQVGVDAKLLPLRTLGGMTLLHGLASDSPAIDTGRNADALDQNNQPLASDQRGFEFARIRQGKADGGLIVDKGAFESSGEQISVALNLTGFDSDVVVNQVGSSIDATQDRASFDGLVGFSFLTQTAAETLGERNFASGNGLPDNGFFPSELLHPEATSAWANGGQPNAKRLLNDKDSFTTSVRKANYSTIHAFATASGPDVDMSVQLHYADGTSTTQSVSVPDVLDEIIPTADRYILIDQLDLASTNGSQFFDFDDAAIFGFRINANVEKVLERITFARPEPQFPPFPGTVRELTIFGAVGGVPLQVVPPILDLDDDNSSGAGGANYQTVFVPGGSAVPIADTDLLFDDLDDPRPASLTATLTNRPDGNAVESLSATTTGTNLTATYTASSGLLSITGDGTIADYAQVLKSVRYNNSSASNGAPRIIAVQVTDPEGATRTATSTVFIRAPQTLVVTTAADESDGDYSHGDFSLREAIQVANLVSSTSDSITFSLPASANGTITLNPSLGDLPTITDTLSVNGGTSGVRIIGATTSDPGTDEFGKSLPITVTRFDPIEVNAGQTLNLTAVSLEQFAGALVNRGTLNVTDSLLAHNVTTANGGAILNTGTARIINSTVSGNTAQVGGGIHNTGTLQLTNATVAFNTASGEGGGVFHGGTSTITVANSILGGNTANTASDLRVADGTATSKVDVDFSLIQSPVGHSVEHNQNNNLVGSDPLLMPLSNNGGATQTHALIPGSPAVDTGSNSLAVNAAGSALTTDQRGSGFDRTVQFSAQSAVVDRGAFELPAAIVVTTLAESSGSGTTLRQAVTQANQSPDFDVISFANDIANGMAALTSTLTLSSSLAVVGRGVTLSSTLDSGTVMVNAGAAVALTDLTIRHSSTDSTSTSAAVTNKGNLVIARGTIGPAPLGVSNEAGGSLTFFDSEITGTTYGGVVNSSAGSVSFIRSSVHGNTGTATATIDSVGSLSLVNSTVSGNASGILVRDVLDVQRTVEIVNSTIAYNYSDSSIESAGLNIALTPTTEAVISNSIFSQSVDDNGNFRGTVINVQGLGFGATPDLTARSNLIIGETGQVQFLRESLFPTSAGNTFFPVFADLFFDPFFFEEEVEEQSTNPNSILMPLASRSGRPPTHSLVSGSVAIDAGNNDLIPDRYSTDQNGIDRIQDGDLNGGTTIDVGAVEFVPTSAIDMPFNLSGTGVANIVSQANTSSGMTFFDKGIEDLDTNSSVHSIATTAAAQAAAKEAAEFGGGGITDPAAVTGLPDNGVVQITPASSTTLLYAKGANGAADAILLSATGGDSMGDDSGASDGVVQVDVEDDNFREIFLFAFAATAQPSSDGGGGGGGGDGDPGDPIDGGDPTGGDPTGGDPTGGDSMGDSSESPQVGNIEVTLTYSDGEQTSAVVVPGWLSEFQESNSGFTLIDGLNRLHSSGGASFSLENDSAAVFALRVPADARKTLTNLSVKRTSGASVVILGGSGTRILEPVVNPDEDRSSRPMSPHSYRTVFDPKAGSVLIADTDAVVGDPEFGFLKQLTAVLNSRPDGDANERLVAPVHPFLSSSYNASTGTLTISGPGTEEEFTEVLRGIEYRNSSMTDTAPRTVTLTATSDEDFVSESTSVQIVPKAVRNFVVDSADGKIDGDLSTGKLSLPEALDLVNFVEDTRDTITFAASLSSIELDNQLVITDDVMITGPGMTKLTIDGRHTVQISSGDSGGVDPGTGDPATGDPGTGDPGTGDPGGDDSGPTSDYRVLAIASGTEVTLAGVTVKGGKAPAVGETRIGGGILNAGNLTLKDVRVTANDARSSTDENNSNIQTERTSGGGIFNSGTLTLEDSRIDGNGAQQGGGIFNSGRLTLTRSRIAGNQVRFRQFLVDAGTVFERTETSGGQGGGLYNAGAAIITDSIVTFNSIAPVSFFGGEPQGAGILNDGLLTLRGTSVFSNSGDGLYQTATDDSSALIVNSTIGQNTGHGIDNRGELQATNTTITQNSKSGIVSIGGTTIHNSIVAGNTELDMKIPLGFTGGAGSVTARHSLVSNSVDESTGLPLVVNGQNGNLVSSVSLARETLSDGRRVYLLESTGETDTSGGLATLVIDAGDNALAQAAGLTTDQRGTGFPRLQDGDADGQATVDIGAIEFRPFTLSLGFASFNADIIANGDDSTRDTAQDAFAPDGDVFVTQSLAEALDQDNEGSGLPNNGVIPASTSQREVRLPFSNDDNGNNASLLRETGDTVSGPVLPGQYQNVTLHVSSAGGSSTALLQLIPGSGSTIDRTVTIPDWQSEPGSVTPLISGLDTVSQNGSAFEQRNAARIFSFPIAVPVSSSSNDATGVMGTSSAPEIIGIRVTKTGGAGRVAVFGATGSLATEAAPTNSSPVLDLDADDSSRAGAADFLTGFIPDGPAVPIVDGDFSLVVPTAGQISGLTLKLGSASETQSLAATTEGTQISAEFDSSAGELKLTGGDTVENYRTVLASVRYRNTSTDASDTTVSITGQVTASTDDGGGSDDGSGTDDGFGTDDGLGADGVFGTDDGFGTGDGGLTVLATAHLVAIKPRQWTVTTVSDRSQDVLILQQGQGPSSSGSQDLPGDGNGGFPGDDGGDSDDSDTGIEFTNGLSLREAIELASRFGPSADTIGFNIPAATSGDGDGSDPSDPGGFDPSDPGGSDPFDPDGSEPAVVMPLQFSLTIDELTVSDGLTIAGTNTQPIQISRSSTASSDFRLFDVAAGAGLTLDRVELSGGQSSANEDGGAIRNQGTLTIRNSLIRDNDSSRDGGAIFSSGTFTAQQTTFASNEAVRDGGAIASSGEITIAATTIADNEAGREGGGLFATSSGTLTNTLIASNTAAGNGPDLRMTSASSLTAAHSLIESGIGHPITNGLDGSIVGVDAGTLTLFDQGGLFHTIALTSASPAIDAGDPVAATDLEFNTDLRGRGFPRLLDGNKDGESMVDIGAFEYTRPTQFHIGDLNADIVVNGANGSSDTQQDVFDASGRSFVTATFAASKGSQSGLPDSGFVQTSTHHPALQLSISNDSNGNNARLLHDVGDTAVITIPSGKYRELHLIASSADSNARFDVTLQYEGESVTQTGLAVPEQSVNLTDRQDLYRVVNDTGRASRDAGQFFADDSVSLFGVRIEVDPTRTLTGATVTKDNSRGTLALFGAVGVGVNSAAPPVVRLGQEFSQFVPGNGPQVLFPDAVINDFDSPELDSILVQLPQRPDGTVVESLSASTTGTMVSATFDASSGTLRLTGPDSVATFERVLRTVSYNNTAVVNTLPRVVTVAANDGGLAGPMETAAIDIIVPQMLKVSTTEDESDGDYSQGNLSLREALEIANRISPTRDTITLSVPGGILLNESLGPLPVIQDAVVINGNAITITGPDQPPDANARRLTFRLLEIDTGVTASISNLAFSQGSGEFGAALLNRGTTSLSQTVFSGNVSGDLSGHGGAVANEGTLTITGSQFVQNAAGSVAGSGGAIYNSGTLTLSQSIVMGNSAKGIAGIGGGIFNSGTLTVSDVSIVENKSSVGGGVFNSGTATLTRTTTARNTARLGGGIDNGGTLTLDNSTVSSNMVQGPGVEGAGVRNTGTLTLASTTVASNIIGSDSGPGGGVYSSNMIIGTNSIIAGSVDQSAMPQLPDVDLFVAGDSTAQIRNSLVQHQDGHSLTNGVDGNIVGADPLLDPLSAGAGAPETHSLQVASPAIDAGDRTSSTAGTDQLKAPRVQMREIDLGSVEFTNVMTVTVMFSSLMNLIDPNNVRTVTDHPLTDGELVPEAVDTHFVFDPEQSLSVVVRDDGDLSNGVLHVIVDGRDPRPVVSPLELLRFEGARQVTFEGPLDERFDAHIAADGELIVQLPHDVAQTVSITESTDDDSRQIVDVVANGSRTHRIRRAGGRITTIGSDLADAVQIHAGAITVDGAGGDDLLDASQADGGVELRGGSGNDNITGGASDDVLHGGPGDDLLMAGSGDDFIDGEAGDDVAFGSAGGDTMVASEGNDVLNGQGTGRDHLLAFGTSADDTFTLTPGGGLSSLTRDDDVNARFRRIEHIHVTTRDGDDSVTSTESSAPLHAKFVVDLGSGHDTFDLSSTSTLLLRPIVRAGDGNDTITLGTAPGIVSAGPGNDIVHGGDGDDQIDGGAGDDVLVGFSGDDRIDGGEGSDVLIGAAGHDLLTAGEGNDFVRGNGGFDTIQGGPGNDRLFGDQAADFVYGGEGDDLIAGRHGNDRLFGQGGDDVITAENGSDFVDGGDGHDKMDGGSDNDVLIGFNGNDQIDGGEGSDTLIGAAGNDVLKAGDGDDFVRGNGGFDTIEGGRGNDRLFGDQAADFIFGGEGDDRIAGRHGNDRLFGQAGDDVIIGEAGSDRIDGGSGQDLVAGGSDNDVLIGGSESDTLLGGTENDSLLGEDGADVLIGNAGNDALNGQDSPDDILVGRNGGDEPDAGDQFFEPDEVDNAFTLSAAMLDQLLF